MKLMKRSYIAVLLLLASCLFAEESVQDRTALKEGNGMNELTKNIHWLGHDTFRLDCDGKIIYFDPYQLKGGAKADLILITHDHFDHCSPADVKKVSGDESVIVTVNSAASKLKGDVRVVKPGDKLTVRGIAIEVVPSYNINKKYHPKSTGNVGYIINVDGVRIYHAGDTDVIPEMKDFKVDVALLPVSGTYVMNVDEAVEAAKILNPKVAIPMHLGAGIGSLSMAGEFRKKATVPVEVLPLEK